jgi:hypothetical protein
MMSKALTTIDDQIEAKERELQLYEASSSDKAYLGLQKPPPLASLISEKPTHNKSRSRVTPNTLKGFF